MDRCGVAATTKYTYTSSQRLRVGATINVVEATTEAVSSNRERQSTCRLCEKIFGHRCRRQGATLHEAPAARKQTSKAMSYICKSLPSSLGDQKKCSEARLTSFHVRTPSI